MLEVKVIVLEFMAVEKQRQLDEAYAHGYRVVGVCGNTAILEREEPTSTPLPKKESDLVTSSVVPQRFNTNKGRR